jgi:hypothetical protein
MPIRTNRGRAAVYRKLWAWPLRSPRHLAMAAFALAVLAIALCSAAVPAVVATAGIAAGWLALVGVEARTGTLGPGAA